MRYRHRQKNHGGFGGSVSQRACLARSQATRVVPVERRFMIRRAGHNLALSRNVVLVQPGRRKRSVAARLYRCPLGRTGLVSLKSHTTRLIGMRSQVLGGFVESRHVHGVIKSP
jgi:hypothetical protein